MSQLSGGRPADLRSPDLRTRLLASAGVAALLLALLSVGCSEPTGLPDPGELRKGSFRADVTGDVERSLRGDVHNYFGRSTRTDALLWWLRLSAPPGTGADSVRFEFLLRVDRRQLPAPGSYPVGAVYYSRDTVTVSTTFRPDSPEGEVYAPVSGTFTLTEAVEGEMVAGTFEFTARRAGVDSPDASRFAISGAFRGGAP